MFTFLLNKYETIQDYINWQKLSTVKDYSTFIAVHILK